MICDNTNKCKDNDCFHNSIHDKNLFCQYPCMQENGIHHSRCIEKSCNSIDDYISEYININSNYNNITAQIKDKLKLDRFFKSLIDCRELKFENHLMDDDRYVMLYNYCGIDRFNILCISLSEDNDYYFIIDCYDNLYILKKENQI